MEACLQECMVFSVLILPLVDSHLSSFFFSQKLVSQIVIFLLILHNQPQFYSISTPLEECVWKLLSFIVSSPSQFMSPGFTLTHALVLLDLLLDLQSFLTCTTLMYQVSTFAVTTISRFHFPFPISVSTFRFSVYSRPIGWPNTIKTWFSILCD